MLRPPLRLVSPPEAGAQPERGDEERPPAPEQANEERLVDALRTGRPWAEREFIAIHGGLVRRVLARILGATPEIDDAAQEVFLRSIDRIRDLRDDVTLQSWVTSFAVFVAREALRRRARKRWLLFFAPEEMPDVDSLEPAGDESADARRAVRATYEVLDRMTADLRTAFALRHIEGMELTDLASACGVSLATVKRRLHRAEATFGAHAKSHPVLRPWSEEGSRWGRA